MKVEFSLTDVLLEQPGLGDSDRRGLDCPLVSESDVVIEYVPSLDEATRDEMVRHWMAVNDADGAVGFRPGASYDEVAVALAAHEAKMDAHEAWLYVARDAKTREIVGFAWWIAGAFGGPHVATIKRLQVHPSRQGTGLGKLLMDHLHTPEVLDRMDGVDILHLQYRVGRGLGGWYATYGYVENARYDVFRKEADGTYGGWAEMIRTRDGSPIPSSGAL